MKSRFLDGGKDKYGRSCDVFAENDSVFCVHDSLTRKVLSEAHQNLSGFARSNYLEPVLD